MKRNNYPLKTIVLREKVKKIAERRFGFLKESENVSKKEED